MMYRIERSIAGDGINWVRSDSFPITYTEAEAQGILDAAAGHLFYRMSPVTRKPYRRHASITPLELRGAHRMLSSARNHVIESSSIGSQAGFAAFQILTDASLRVTRELEAL